MKKYNFLTQKYFMAFIVSLFTLAGCYNNDLEPLPNHGKEGGSYIISMDIPGIDNPTRAMTKSDESQLSTISCLVFDNDGKYLYTTDQAEQQPAATGAPANKRDYKVKLKQTTNPVHLVIITNHTLEEPTAGELKADFLAKQKFSAAVKWPNTQAFPMWGETATFKVGEEGITDAAVALVDNKLPVKLLRAIARIDVGLNFTGNNLADETVGGLTDFKLGSVTVFRTKQQGNVAPLKANISGGLATAPSLAGLTVADFTDTEAKTAMHYTISPAANSYVREIYIPETNLSTATDKDDRTCLVIGGYYGANNNSVISYYRVDFTKPGSSSTSSTFFPILRNNRYRINIKDVKGAGASSIDDALKGVQAELIVAEVTPWNEQSLDMFVSGNYHFGVSARKLEFGSAQGFGATSGTKQYEEGHKEIAFESNLTPGYWKEIIMHHTDDEGNAGQVKKFNEPNSLPWTIPGTHFEVYELSDAGIKFRTNADNSTALIERTITLEIPHTKIKFEVELIQDVFMPIFNISCSPEVFGIARKGKDLTSANYVEFTATLGEGAVFSTPFDVHLVTKTVNGMKFSGSGTFNPGQTTTKIKMQGSGKPTAIMPTHFIVTSTATELPFECEFTVRVSLHPKRILCINNAAPNSVYSFGGSTTVGYKIIQNKYNFGSTEAQSKVPVDKIDIDVKTLIPPLFVQPIDLSTELGPNIDPDGLKYDILVTTYPTHFSHVQADAVEAFVRRGGVLIYQQQDGEPGVLDQPTAYGPNFQFMSRLFADAGDTPSASWGGTLEKFQNIGLFGATWDAVPYAAVVTNQPHLIFPRSILTNDLDQIVNGPFGDVRGRYWGQDAGHTSGFVFTDEQTKKVHRYSTMEGTASGLGAHYKNTTSMFRMKNFNVFFVGDAGFTAQPFGGGWTDADAVAYPFVGAPDPRNNGYGVPIPKPNYGSGTIDGQRTVYNSIIFCNVLTWACEAIEYKWNRYDSDGVRLPCDTDNMINWEGVPSPQGAPLY